MIVTGSRLHFACGDTRWSGFENSDIRGGDVYLDLEDHPYPYGDETAEIIMISHALPGCFGPQDLRPIHPNFEPIMWEFHRILQPGGWLRIDDNPVRIYKEGENLPKNEISAEAGSGFPPRLHSSRDDLIATLEQLGFTVHEIDPGTSRIPCDDETLAAIIGNHGSHYSFALEAQK